MINKQEQISSLLDEIRKNGYSNATKQFIKKNPNHGYRFNKKEGCVAFPTLNKNSSKCLIINSDLGNIPEFLSGIFDDIVSLDIHEKIQIQKHRFEEKDICNIRFIECKTGRLPITEKEFDLVVINGIKVEEEKSNEEIRFYLESVKELLNEQGCLCLGVKNKHGIQLFQEIIDDDIFLDDFKGYRSQLESLNFKIDAYWTVASHNQINFWGRMDDDISIKWFIQNFDKKFFVDKKFKMIGKILKMFTKSIRKNMMERFCPSFIFCCYKNSINTLEKTIYTKTGFNSSIQHNRPTKILYFLFDDNGKPMKVVTCKPTSYELTEEIFQFIPKFPGLKILDEKLIIEDWVEGIPLNRLNEVEVKLVLNWLINFQIKTQNEILKMSEIDEEIKFLKIELELIKEISDLPYHSWLEEFREEFVGKEIRKSAVHGDFNVRNLLIDHDKFRANIIDWDSRYQDSGNPVYDFVWFATASMALSNNLENEYSDMKSKTRQSVEMIANVMNEHLGAKFDFLKLQRFMLLRFLPIRNKIDDDGHLFYIDILRVLAKIEK